MPPSSLTGWDYLSLCRAKKASQKHVVIQYWEGNIWDIQTELLLYIIIMPLIQTSLKLSAE